jgi:solute carrier family 25 carnitine/acylcarnitine transporter 20/29
LLKLCSFWSYQLSKQALSVDDESNKQQALKILLCGGLAGVVTWASIFPLGMIFAVDPFTSVN